MRKKKEIEKIKASFGRPKDEHSRFEHIEKYFRNKDNSSSWHVISERTCNDLDFQELFQFLDRTSSKVGQQFLYNKLRNIPGDQLSYKKEEKIIQNLTNDEDLRINTQILLNKLNTDDAYFISSLFQDKHIDPPHWFFLIRILSFSNLLCFILLPWISHLMFLILGIFIVNLGIHYWNKRHLFQYLVSIPQLLQLHKVALSLNKINLYKDVKSGLHSSLKQINQVRNRMQFFELEVKLQGDFQGLFWLILELIKIAFLLEPLLLFTILKRLDSKRKEVEDLFCFVGQIDSLVSIASLRNGLDTYSLPTIVSHKVLARNIYHPLIIDCISNSIDISDKSILITGSNMSGKTSFIRTIGINMITGLTINTCFAESIEIPRLRIYSAIRINDDLMNDKSYYLEEVETIKKMINDSTDEESNLFLLDEIFKGTNTIERISAGKAVLSMLAKNTNIVFVSTHDIELTDMLSEEYELYHFSEIVKENRIDFDYKLKEGKLKNRNAIRILQVNDYPDSVINEAKEIAKLLDRITVANAGYTQ